MSAVDDRVERLRAEVQEVQKERDCLRHGQQVTPMELQTTMQTRSADVSHITSRERSRFTTPRLGFVGEGVPPDTV